MRQAGRFSGAYVVDLTANRVLYANNANTGRLPASVEKLYTTTTALQRFGPNATLTTSVLGCGTQAGGTFTGTLYLRGGGDPTFGSSSFDSANYGTGRRSSSWSRRSSRSPGSRALNGNVVADETMFDSDRGTPATGNEPSIEVEGELSALAYNRGWANSIGTVYFKHPGGGGGSAVRRRAARRPASACRSTSRSRAGATPADATTLASVHSPPIATLVSLTNTPSDNFFAEMLLKDLGARFGARRHDRRRRRRRPGADGQELRHPPPAQRWLRTLALGPHDPGAGGHAAARTWPPTPPFTARWPWPARRARSSTRCAAPTPQGRCRGKTGTLHDASNVVGYCQAADGHTLAYAFLMNGICPDYAHPIQDRMQVALAKYSG